MMSKTEILRPNAPVLIAASDALESKRALELWLRSALAARFDPVLTEALPADMLAALSQTH